MINIEGLSHRYPSRNSGSMLGRSSRKNETEFVLSDVNLEVAEGDRLVILGSSGSGKSTLLRCTNLSIRPTQGKVFISDREITSLPSKEVEQIRRQIGVISQHFNLIEGATALKNVLMGRLGHVRTIQSIIGHFSDEDVSIATESLLRVGLSRYAQNRVSDLSGGQKQRVAIARALAQRPRIILADEPVSSLDPKLMKEIMDLIEQICLENRITLIASLHFLEMARSYATRLVGIKDGQIVFNNTPDEITDKDIVDIYGETEDWILYGKRGF